MEGVEGLLGAGQGGAGERRRRGGGGEGTGGGGRCLPLRHFRSFALLEEAFPLAGAGYGSDGV